MLWIWWPRASCGLFDVAHGTAVRLVVVVKNVWGSWACRDFGDGRFSLAASSNLNDSSEIEFFALIGFDRLPAAQKLRRVAAAEPWDFRIVRRHYLRDDASPSTSAVTTG